MRVPIMLLVSLGAVLVVKAYEAESIDDDFEDLELRKDRARCYQPMESGSCTEWNRAWYYDVKKHGCFNFKYSGCGGTENNFKTLLECEELCDRVGNYQRREDHANAMRKQIERRNHPVSNVEVKFAIMSDGFCPLPKNKATGEIEAPQELIDKWNAFKAQFTGKHKGYYRNKRVSRERQYWRSTGEKPITMDEMLTRLLQDDATRGITKRG